MPRDDQTCFVWSASWNPDGPLSEEDRESIRKETFIHEQVEPVTFRAVRNKDNNYLIDRNEQRASTMTGIHGFAAQDQAVQEKAWSPICDRTQGTPRHQRHGHHCGAPVAAGGDEWAGGRTRTFRRSAWRGVLGSVRFAVVETGCGV